MKLRIYMGVALRPCPMSNFADKGALLVPIMFWSEKNTKRWIMKGHFGRGGGGIETLSYV